MFRPSCTRNSKEHQIKPEGVSWTAFWIYFPHFPSSLQEDLIERQVCSQREILLWLHIEMLTVGSWSAPCSKTQNTSESNGFTLRYPQCLDQQRGDFPSFHWALNITLHFQTFAIPRIAQYVHNVHRNLRKTMLAGFWIQKDIVDVPGCFIIGLRWESVSRTSASERDFSFQTRKQSATPNWRRKKNQQLQFSRRRKDSQLLFCGKRSQLLLFCTK